MAESSEKTAKPRSTAVLGDVEAVVRPVLELHGLDLFELSFRLEQGGWVLRVIIDTAEAGDPMRHVSIVQCADVSRDLSAALDEADPLPQVYTLEVSSPGVERPLRGRTDYARFVGQPAKITLHAPMEGAGAVIRGKLAGVEEDSVLVDVEQPQPLSIPLPSIKRANLVYEMPGEPKKGTSKKKRRSTTGRQD